MKTVSILVLENAVIQAIADPQYCFEAVNQFFIQAGKQAPFNVQLVGMKNEVKLNSGGYTVHCNKLLKDVKNTDLIFIPALFGDMQQALESNQKVIPWIVEQYHKGAEVASLCVGAFLLAATGLIDNKKCSTHWGFENQLKQMFPSIDIQNGCIITEENRIYSSGGANSYWNLLLHIVEKYTNRDTAILTSKYFAIDINRNSQAAFALFQGQKSHTDDLVKKAQTYIETNVEKKITVDELAASVAMGRRSFERRFRKATNNSVLEYIQRVKIEAAKRNLESTLQNVNEVMFNIGYTDTKAFRTLFKKNTGLTPIEYRNKYNKV
ncbi:MAG: helix-turn-helix domain-containing protein [Bacteroidia bacterium]